MKSTPRCFALQLGSLITLYISITAMISLVFATTNLALPDASDSIWDIQGYQNSLKLSFSVLAVFFPAYVYLTHRVNEDRRTIGSKYIKITKWLVHISILIGALIILGNLVTLIHTFLNGEISARFIFKSVALAVLLGHPLYYYRLDATDYWVKHKRLSIMHGAVAGVVALGILGASLYYIEPPQKTRDFNIDQMQISDLRTVYWEVNSFYSEQEGLPDRLEDVYKDTPIPVAPDGRTPYRYEKVSDDTYRLCATFASESRIEEARPSFPGDITWYHKSGDWCFQRHVQTEKSL